MLTILFDGIAYGHPALHSCRRPVVTLGLMNFINLAHGAFAMAGGYITVIMVQPARHAVPEPAGGFHFHRGTRAFLERTLYVHLYDKSHLDQVLFSLGLIFMSIAAVDYFMGANQQIVNLPPSLRRPAVNFFGVEHRLLPAVRHHHLRRLLDDRLAARADQDALRLPAARLR